MSKALPIPSVFSPDIMPEKLPLFPLSGIVLLPHAKLPLNVFEPRYLALVQDILGTPERMIGIIQPQDTTNERDTKLYQVGCAGRITSFNETEDGRFLISLTGICRFTIAEELPGGLPYRVARVKWSSYEHDFDLELDEEDVDRERLITAMKRYFKIHEIAADWNTVQGTPLDALIASLVMIAPLSPSEKQALLECLTLPKRAEMLVTLLEMAHFPHAEGEGGVKH